jgi:ubiquinone/menaquinone biosynthesis C-methylase UbiE
MLSRVLEPEVMDTVQEAEDYDAMDHAQVNQAFCDDLLRARADLRRVLDVGTGTARIPILLCERHPTAQIVAIDLAESMLDIARRNVAAAGYAGRIEVRKADAKRSSLGDGEFDAVVSNSIVHHIPEPARVLTEMWRLLAPGGLLFVRDLARPGSIADIERLVETYAPRTPNADAEVYASQTRARDLFGMSLHAALTVDEVRALVAPLGIHAGAVTMTSDRHWTLVCEKPSCRDPAPQGRWSAAG